ncbi:MULTISPECIES: hypothetical protein [Streptomyces]|uniref:Uncharacterized protein n=1 Tax=Streptomyces doudnae TaxID=3075536 RepID=A0ABD5ELV7_9ACTN|nr:MULTISPECIES: hypothetical protein [unclassified Streptomyces]MDT0435598.1 hypothetical protein [Streptomyces sp. DSM 41981]MYQ62553.1 hypothetical protein [Streptomyces sp. SID4950]SCD39848.1 hypothetical protein GA0115242_104857 [Streptomyces sp. SolWspMP-5a-2]
MAPEPHQPAQTAYEAYVESVGGRAFNGDALPDWEALPARIQTAWHAAANALLKDQDHNDVGGGS